MRMRMKEMVMAEEELGHLFIVERAVLLLGVVDIVTAPFPSLSVVGQAVQSLRFPTVCCDLRSSWHP